jgi:hypothetical protein
LALSSAIAETWPTPCLIQKRRKFIRRSRPNMKKLLIMLFTLAIAFSLAMPVFAQDTSSSQSSDTTTTTKSKKKTPKVKK